MTESSDTAFMDAQGNVKEPYPGQVSVPDEARVVDVFEIMQGTKEVGDFRPKIEAGHPSGAYLASVADPEPPSFIRFVEEQGTPAHVLRAPGSMVQPSIMGEIDADIDAQNAQVAVDAAALADILD